MNSSSLIPRQGERNRVALPPGSGDALLLSRLAQTRRPLIVVSESAAEAQRLIEELRFFSQDRRVHLFPDWETLPYDAFSPHQDLISERLETLHQISRDECDIVVVPVTTMLYRLPPTEFLASYTFFLKRGQSFDIERFRKQLTLASYSHVSQVVSPGEYSIRGGVIDVFPMGSVVPYRIDLFGDEIDSIRTFDVDTQRSIYRVGEIRLLPAREFPTDSEARKIFRTKFRESVEGDPTKSRIYKDVSQGGLPAGIEYYLPLFFDETATLIDYLPEQSLVCLQHDIAGAVQKFWEQTNSRYRLLRGDPDRPLLPPGHLFLREDELFGAVKPFPRLELLASTDQASQFADPLPNVAVNRRADDPLTALKAFAGDFVGRVLVIADSLGRRETLLDLFREYGLHPPAVDDWDAFEDSDDDLIITVGEVHTGFIDREHEVALITENELFPAQARTRTSRERRVSTEHMLRDLSEVKPGDPVVHIQHGVGRYTGLTTMDLGDGPTEFLNLEYDGGDKLYVPVSQLEVISRYSGGPPDLAPLHRLGSGQWDKAKRRAAAQIRDTAAELLSLYALRASRKGYAFGLDSHDYAAFSDGFPFEETADQAGAIDATISDLKSTKPMDRLICGDVGFGKTEVALRAAFVAVADNRQVAVLVPTTLLAEQHFQTFSDRFAEYPVKIAELSRFRTGKETSAALAGLAEGSIDIVIGTHKLLSRGVKFKNLGLVIIDEEHRFGVRQKEKLKALRAEVDVLTLTATPIPRTLAMAMEGLRDFSVIATAPQKRLAIKTFVAPFSDGLIREAVLRELKRGGQIYFLHNEVSSIARMHDKLTALLPEARIRVAHGQMHERDLELAMRDFYQARFNMLLCTTIIETGIDIPTANTMIINRADRFGLAQLHQLRGRVGRSHHQAYAYLLTPEEEALRGQAKKRLEAIQMMDELGAGFFLAMHDLEIRGAGEVLGESQSGEMQEVGFQLYVDMLNRAVKSLKTGKEPNLDIQAPSGIEINLHMPALMPESYCANVHQRLVIYKRLANTETEQELEAMQEEIVDRFGTTPDPVKALIESHRLRIAAKQLGIVRIDASAETITVQFMPEAPVDPGKIIDLVQSRADTRFAGPERLRVETSTSDLQSRGATIRELLAHLV
ncbi:MAG: transcription-repair coupling factor [Betaproteobacteria bacterium]|nr:MAG: transcription-repair coupling factor [Betaproteobacteria bacterium]